MISLLCPTRGRPHGVRRLLDSLVATASGADWRLWLYVDDDDPARAEYGELLDSGVLLTIVFGSRLVLSDYWNVLARIARGDIMGMVGDDTVFRSQGWDALLERTFAEYPDGIAFVYGKDGFRDELHGSQGFVTRKWVDTLGKFTTPDFSHDYCDTWMNDIAEAVGRRRYLPDLHTAHLHPDNPALGVVVDATYREGRERGVRDGVAALYDSPAQRVLRDGDVVKLRAVLS
jgi:hypothetical protein